MQIIKLEAGEYRVIKDNTEYLISKDSYAGGWSIYSEGKYVSYKRTKKECLDYIERGTTVKILDSISIVPPIDLDASFTQKSFPKRKWRVDDVFYSTRDGKWKISGYYYNNSSDTDMMWWDYDAFLDECEVQP